MRGRFLVAGVGVFASVAPLFAQLPQFPRLGTNPPGYPPMVTPNGPRMLPPAVTQPTPSQPGPTAQSDGTTQLQQVNTPLPHPENKFTLDSGSVSYRRTAGGWQVWAGSRVLKTLGGDELAARDVAHTLRELHPTEWVTIGSPRPVVEYGLINGRPGVFSGSPRQVLPIDLRTVRIEPVKGVWCLRDDGNLLFNFGLNKSDAEQSLAVVRRYGFNRVGIVGETATPALTYFFVSLDADDAKPSTVNPLAVAVQENALTRTGIPVPGFGYIGEMIRIDPQKVESRRDGAEWVVAHGTEVIARFGPTEWMAREAARVIRDGRFTEFCKAGGAGMTFFLVDGKAPTHVPFSVQGRRFDLSTLRVQAINGKWKVTENGRPLFDVAGQQDGEAMVRLLKYYGFDQMCQVGPTSRVGLTFLAKSR